MLTAQITVIHVQLDQIQLIDLSQKFWTQGIILMGFRLKYTV